MYSKRTRTTIAWSSVCSESFVDYLSDYIHFLVPKFAHHLQSIPAFFTLKHGIIHLTQVANAPYLLSCVVVKDKVLYLPGVSVMFLHLLQQ